MEKKVAEHILAEIRQQSITNPKTIKLVTPDNADDTMAKWRLEDIVNNFKTKRNLHSGKKSLHQNKYLVIYAIINTGIYSSEIGHQCGINMAEIQTTYSHKYYLNQYLKTTEQEWRHQVVQLGQQYDKEEEKAHQDFRNSSLLNQLINEDVPRYYILAELSKAYDERIKAKEELDKLDERLWQENKLSGTEIAKRHNTLQQKIKHPLKTINLMLSRLHKNSTSNERFKKRKIYIDIANKNIQYDPELNINMYCSSVSQGETLIRKYCSWYNTLNQLEIKKTKKVEESEKRKAKYQEKNANKIAAKKQQRIKERMEVYELQIQGMSINKMAEQLPYGKTKIKVIIDDIRERIGSNL